MELRYLRYFVATAEAGTVTAAAARLHLTQPALSRQLRRLERELGVRLFEPAGRGLELSPAARALLPLARDVLGRADALRVAAAFHAHGRLERLTIGAPTVTLTDVVAPFIATLEPEDPTADVLGADGLSPVETLRRGADLAIGTVSAPAPFRSEPLAVLPVWAYVPEGHAWRSRPSAAPDSAASGSAASGSAASGSAASGSAAPGSAASGSAAPGSAAPGAVTLGELLVEPLIVLPASSTARQALEAALASAGAGYAGAPVEAANGTVAQALAAAGRGIAVVSDDPRFGLAPLAVELGDRRLSIRLVALWDSRHAAAATIEEFAHRLGRFVRDRYDAPAA